jgi:hypothetical protein
MFAWKPIYQEIAHEVLDYEHRQSELIEFIRRLRAKGLPVIGLRDETADGEVELSEIDPFTFFACFNRGQSAETRRYDSAMTI